jgi:hypothetical protein
MTRIVVCAGLFVATCLLVTLRSEPLVAQEKKDKKEAALEKQIAALKQDLALAQQQVTALKADIVQGEKANAALKAANTKLQADNAQLAATLKGTAATDDKTLKGLQSTIDGFRNAGLVHVVVLKLKADVLASEAQSVIDDANSQLTKIKAVRGLWAGKPAAIDRSFPNAATNYTIALVVLFDDSDGLKAYLKDPIHDKFVDKHLKFWELPLVFDFEPKKLTP